MSVWEPPFAFDAVPRFDPPTDVVGRLKTYFMPARWLPRERTLYAVLARDGRLCAYCGTELDWLTYTLDHVEPRHRGGRSVIGNLVLACKSCNSTKGKRSLLAFFAARLIKEQAA